MGGKQAIEDIEATLLAATQSVLSMRLPFLHADLFLLHRFTMLGRMYYNV